jgi:hypothetical protein
MKSEWSGQGGDDWRQDYLQGRLPAHWESALRRLQQGPEWDSSFTADCSLKSRIHGNFFLAT